MHNPGSMHTDPFQNSNGLNKSDTKAKEVIQG